MTILDFFSFLLLAFFLAYKVFLLKCFFPKLKHHHDFYHYLLFSSEIPQVLCVFVCLNVHTRMFSEYQILGMGTRDFPCSSPPVLSFELLFPLFSQSPSTTPVFLLPSRLHALLFMLCLLDLLLLLRVFVARMSVCVCARVCLCACVCAHACVCVKGGSEVEGMLWLLKIFWEKSKESHTRQLLMSSSV